MNRIEYMLTEDDLVKFNLYFAETSPVNRQRRFKCRVLIPILYFVLALYPILNQYYIFASLTIVTAVLWFFLSPFWFRRGYRKYYKQHVAETMGDSLKKIRVVELLPDGFLSTTSFGESKYRYDAVDKIVEHDGFTYIYIGKSMAVILPHDRIPSETIQWWVDEIERKK